MSELIAENNDPIDDLVEIVGELRAYLEWQATSGAVGLPRDARPPSTYKPTLAPIVEQEHVQPPQPSPELVQAIRREPVLSPDLPAAVTAPNPANSAGVARKDLSQPQNSTLRVLANDLSGLSALVQTCTQCSLHAERKQTVFARGTGASGLCFVGEGPGADEDEQGLPFVGAAGQLLDKMIGAMGLDQEEVYICNIVKCRPPNNRKPTDEEISTCSPYLQNQLELIRPQVIVALGGTATLGLLGDTRGITKIRGKFRLYQGKIAVMPTFHPAYLLRNPDAKKEVWSDLRQVLQHMGRSLPPK